MNTPVRRVGLLGDIHCQHRSLTAALTFFSSERCDIVLAVGDVVDGLGDVEATVQILRKAMIQTVRGNHERWLLANQMRDLNHATVRDDLSAASWQWLANLPATLRIETVAGSLLLCHGLGSMDMQRVFEDEPQWCDPSDPTFERFAKEAAGCRYAVGGHTHQRMVRDVCGVTFINPGTLVPMDDPCVAVVDVEQQLVWHHDLVDASVVVSPWQCQKLP
jgi:predicted phosphodiesterase